MSPTTRPAPIQSMPVPRGTTAGTFERFAAMFLSQVAVHEVSDWQGFIDDPRVPRIATALRNLNVGEPEHILGGGDYGLAAAGVPGQVIELTSDQTEVHAGALLAGLSGPYPEHVARVFSSHFIRGVKIDALVGWDDKTEEEIRKSVRVGVLLVERVTTKELPTRIPIGRIVHNFKAEWNVYPSDLARLGRKRARERLREASEGLAGVLRARHDWFLDQIADGLDELRALGIYAIDVHQGNVGYLDGTAKIFDIGSSSSPPGLKVPVAAEECGPEVDDVMVPELAGETGGREAGRLTPMYEAHEIDLSDDRLYPQSEGGDLGRVFQWLTRNGMGMHFPGTPIGWYQNHQIHAIETIQQKVRSIPGATMNVRVRHGMLESRRSDGGWVSLGLSTREVYDQASRRGRGAEEDCIGVHTHRDARPLAEEARHRKAARHEGRFFVDVGSPPKAAQLEVTMTRAGYTVKQPSPYATYVIAFVHSPEIIEEFLEELGYRGEITTTDPDSGAEEDYVAVDSRGRVVGGPFKYYDDAKAVALTHGGLVKFAAEAYEGCAEEARKDPKFERCVQHVKAQGTAVNPWAVCHATLGEDRLSYSQKKNLPASAFALPEKRALPLIDAAHVRNASARLSMMRHEGHVTKAEYAKAHKRIVAAGKKFGVQISEVLAEVVGAGEDFNVATRDEHAVAAGGKHPPLKGPREIYDFTAPMLAKFSQEVMLIIPLDIHGVPLSDKPFMVGMGQRDRVSGDMSDILRPVIQTNAAGFALVHCHPSRKATPSAADKSLTEDVRKAAAVACPSSAFVDHVVVGSAGGKGEYYSFTDGKLYRA